MLLQIVARFGFVLQASFLCPNRQFPSCLSPLFQSESKCEAFHMKISFIHKQILVHLHVNKTNFRMKGFALGLALKQAKGNSDIAYSISVALMLKEK